MSEEVLVDEVPNFDKKQIVDVAKELYGIEGEIRPLNAFEDQNARIKAHEGSFVLKIANKRWSHEELTVQTLLLDHLKIEAPKISWPRVVPNLKGDTMTKVEGFNVRLLTYIEGNILADVERNPALNYSIGSVLGQFSKAVESFRHPVPVKPNDYWNLDNVMACKAFIEDLDDPGTRSSIEQFYKHYENRVLPKIKGLRKATIHGDANEQNFLVNKDNPSEIVGLIDFGDLQRATHINDLAIALAYSLLDVDDIDSASREIISGYQSEFSIQQDEFEVLFDLVAMRLISSIILSSHRAKQFPENLYIVTSQKPAKVLLERFETWEFKMS